MINPSQVRWSDLMALKSQAAEIKRSADRLNRLVQELEDHNLETLTHAQADYLEDQINSIVSHIGAIRVRFIEERRTLRVAVNL